LIEKRRTSVRRFFCAGVFVPPYIRRMTLRGWLTFLVVLELVAFLYRKACDSHDARLSAQLPEGEEPPPDHRDPVWVRVFEPIWRATHVGALAALMVGAIMLFVLKRNNEGEPVSPSVLQVLNFAVLAATGWLVSWLATRV
jgi:hypothetical protein